MKLDQEKSDFLDEMLQQWQEQQLLSEEQVKKLQSSYEAKNFDWRRLAQYSFWIAMACGVISLGALLVDKSLMVYLKKLYDTPDGIISFLCALAAGGFYYYGFQRTKKHQMKVFSNDAIIFTGVVCTALAIGFFVKSLENSASYIHYTLLFTTLVYGLLAFFFKSRLLWFFSLIGLGCWFAAQTAVFSGQVDFLFLGLNFPVRFVFFGLLITLISLAIRNNNTFKPFFGTSYIAGMVYLFVSLWLVSIFGNFTSLNEWHGIRQTHMFPWALLSAAGCIGSIFAGLKYRDDVAREFGITFLFLNLYTRYFEYFWDSWHKALFFCVLAASFWFIGKRAEKIWNLEFLKK